MEEADLCWRLQQLGYRIMVCPKSEVYHLGGGTLQASSPFKTYLNFRNNLILLHKNLPAAKVFRSEEHTSELQSLMRISYAVFCLKQKTTTEPMNTIIYT